MSRENAVKLETQISPVHTTHALGHLRDKVKDLEKQAKILVQESEIKDEARHFHGGAIRKLFVGIFRFQRYVELPFSMYI